jgi:hypothetical protein
MMNNIDADLLNGVPVEPGSSLNVGAAINAGMDTLWKHYVAVCDSADRELTIVSYCSATP